MDIVLKYEGVWQVIFSAELPLFFRKFPEKFRRKFPEISELTTLYLAPAWKQYIDGKTGIAVLFCDPKTRFSAPLSDVNKNIMDSVSGAFWISQLGEDGRGKA